MAAFWKNIFTWSAGGMQKLYYISSLHAFVNYCCECISLDSSYNTTCIDFSPKSRKQVDIYIQVLQRLYIHTVATV